MNAILAFVLGLFSAVCIGFLILAVVGYFKAKKIEKRLEGFITQVVNNTDTSNSNLWTKVQELEKDFEMKITIIEKEFNSELDSRLNKFENKFENKFKITKPEFSDVLTKERLEAAKRIMDKQD